MQELFPESGDEDTPMSDDAKQIIKYQGNVEAFRLFLTDKIQCEHSHKYVIAGHVYCCCGRLLNCKDPDPEIQEQAETFCQAAI